MLAAIQISEGFFASDVIEFVEVTSGVSRGLQMSETMRSVMVTSSVKALSRRLPEGEIQPPNQTKKMHQHKKTNPPPPEGVIRLPHGTNMYPKIEEVG
jgi:hypothetical protein